MSSSFYVNGYVFSNGVGDVCVVLFVSVCRCTVSNALLMSRAIAIVRCGGLFALNPVVMVLFMWCSAVVVDLCCLKPCWCSGSVM